MRGLILYLIFAMTGISIQATLFKGIRPDFVLILVCFCSLRYGQAKGIAYGALTGLLIDSLNGIILGPNILSKSLSGFLVSLISRKIFFWNITINTLVIMALSFLDIIIVQMSLEIFSVFSFRNLPFEISIMQIFYTTVASLILYPFFLQGKTTGKFMHKGVSA